MEAQEETGLTNLVRLSTLPLHITKHAFPSAVFGFPKSSIHVIYAAMAQADQEPKVGEPTKHRAARWVDALYAATYARKQGNHTLLELISHWRSKQRFN